MAIIRRMKMTIGPRPKIRAQPKELKNPRPSGPRLGFTTPYCSHRHKSKTEAIECARRSRMKLAKMRGGI